MNPRKLSHRTDPTDNLPECPDGGGSSVSPVLIVEKDPALADMMGEVLRRAYGCVHVARTLSEALAHLATERIAAVVLDADTMLADDGEGPRTMLADWFRGCASPPPFILVSVRVPPEAPRRGPDLPPLGCCVAWVPKPFRVEQLLAVVRRTIQSPPPRRSVPGRAPHDKPLCSPV